MRFLKAQLHLLTPAGDIGGLGLIVDLPEEPGVGLGLTEAADSQVIGDGDVEGKERVPREALGRLRPDQLHQRVQGVEVQGVRMVDDGPNLVGAPVRIDGEGAVANGNDLGLGGLLDVLDKLFQHDWFPPYANLMTFRTGGASWTSPSIPVWPGICGTISTTLSSSAT